MWRCDAVRCDGNAHDLDLSMAPMRGQQHELLRVLQGVEVVVEDIRPHAQGDGLSQEAIRAAVELIFRSKGMRS